MADTTGSRLVPPVLVAVLVIVALVGGACGGDSGGEGGAGTTTASTLSFEERDAAIQLNLAATGMNLVAADVSLLTASGKADDYCRSKAPGELGPHKTKLEAAADPSVRQAAQVALADLGTAIGLCADGADPAAIQDAVKAYNASFERLRTRIEALVGADR